MPSDNMQDMEEATTDQQPNQAALSIDQNNDIESKPAQQQSLVRGDAVRRSKASTVEQEKEGYLNRRSFIANFILLLGYTFGLWFQVYEFQGRDRTTIAITVYFVAFVLLILSGLLELSVDIFSTRSVGHGRYHSTSYRWNRFISLLFISAGILDAEGTTYRKTSSVSIGIHIICNGCHSHVLSDCRSKEGFMVWDITIGQGRFGCKCNSVSCYDIRGSIETYGSFLK